MENEAMRVDGNAIAGILGEVRAQADLVAARHPAFCDLHLHPGARHSVTVLDGHAREALGEMLHLHARLLGLVQFGGELGDQVLREHGATC